MITASNYSAAVGLKQIVPTAVTDDADLKKLFANRKILPYAGSSAMSNHSYARLLIDLCHMSNSRGSCHQDILDYSFESGDLEIKQRNRSGFKIKLNEDVSDDLKNRYIDALQEIGYNGTRLRALSKDLERERMATGFAVLLGAYARVGDARSIDVMVAGLEHVILTRSDDGSLFAVYFPNGIGQLKESKEHYIYKVYESAEEAILDIGNEPEALVAIAYRNGRKPYGRPMDFQALREMVTEASYAIHDEKVSTAITTAKAIISYPVPAELENQPIGDSEESTTEINEAEEAIRKTRKALDKNEIGFLPFEGELSPSLMNIAIARDSKHRETLARICEKAIYAANKWSTDLTGATSPSGGIGSGYLRDMIAFKNATVIRGTQHRATEPVNEMLRIALQNEEFQDITHAFANPLDGFDFDSGEDEIDLNIATL